MTTFNSNATQTYRYLNRRTKKFIITLDQSELSNDGKHMCTEIRVLIRDCYKNGKTKTEISKQFNLSSVIGVIQMFKKTRNIENNISNRGRTSAITALHKRKLVKIVKAGRRQSLKN